MKSHDNDTAPAPAPTSSAWIYWLLMVIVPGAFLIGPNLIHLAVNHNDAYDHLPWMYRWSDPDLFPNDLVTDYYQKYHLPPGMRALYYGLNQGAGIDLNVASRIVAAFFYLATIILLYRAVRCACGTQASAAVVAGVILFTIPYNISPLVTHSLFSTLLGGLARAAVSATLLLAIYGIAKPSRIASNAALVSGAAFYPPAFVIVFLALAISVLASGSLRAMLRQAVALVPGGVVSAIIVVLWYPLGVDPRFGPMIGVEDFAWAPEAERLHFPFGRSFVRTVVYGWAVTCWPAVAAVALQALVYRRGSLLRANLMLLGASLIATAVGYLGWPKFYEISRFEFWPRNVVVAVAIASVLTSAVAAIAERWPRWRATRLVWLSIAMYLAFNAALEIYRSQRGRPVRPVEFNQLVYDRLAEMPKDTRVASLPDEGSDTIPLFSKRSLVIPPSALCPYHRDFHRQAIDRFLAVQAAVYAVDWSAVRELRDQYGIRYLVIDRSRFVHEQFEKKAASPFARLYLPNRVLPVLQMDPDSPFVFRQAPPEAVAIEVGDRQLIDLTRIP